MDSSKLMIIPSVLDHCRLIQVITCIYFSGDLERMRKQNALKCLAHILGDLCGGKLVYKNNFSKFKGRFKGGEMMTATGNRMPLLKAASRDTACESVASLTFFPLSSFARHQLYFPLNPQILQFSCNDLFLFFIFSPLHVEFPLERSGSSFSTRLKPQFHLCNARILNKSISLSSSSDHSSCCL